MDLSKRSLRIVWHRNGFFRVTLAGHPLSTFAGDTHKDAATGEGIKSFGGTWHVTKATNTGATTTITTTTPTGTTTGTTTTPCLYPPCY